MNRTLLRASLAACCAAALAAGSVYADAVVTFGSIPAGADEAGHVQLYAPDPATGGSSISHWDLATSPLLMWPAISNLLDFHQTDLTMPLFRDLSYPDGVSTFTVEYLDPAGFGFNETDAAPAAPGNPGTTFGEQRRFVLEQTLDKWASLVGKTTPTKVLAVHIDNFCDATSAVLASAGPTYLYTGFVFDGKDVAAGTMLGEHIAGEDFTSSSDPDVKPEGDFDEDGDLETGDIIVYVNQNIDYDGGCLGGAGYYYGMDSNNGTQVNFANVLLHEIGHGIGFASFTNRSPASVDFGEFFAEVPGIYDLFILDNSTGEHFDEMTKAERQASIVNGPNVVWDGANVAAESAGWAKLPSVEVLFPEGGGEFEAQAAAFGARVFGEGAVIPTGQVVIANPARACTAIDDVTGKIVLIERNDCTFISKFENAVAAGATAVIVYNSASPSSGTPEDLVAMAGESDNTTVPALFLRRSDGLELRDLVINGPDLACTPGPATACLLGGRFQVNVAYTTESSAGVGQVMSFNGARAESDQSAFFFFFDNANFEMGVKMVDACSFNDSFWVFVSGLTNQGFVVNILDTFTGQSRPYLNPLGNYPQTVGATDGVSGFDCTPGAGARYEKPTPAQVREVLRSTPIDPLGDSLLGQLAPTADPATTACSADDDTACHLGGRFEVEVHWTTVSDTGSAKVMSFGGQRASSDQSSFWWFFDPANFEMGVKMVDACVPPFNAYWVFVSGLTNQAFDVEITDTTSTLSRHYTNPLGSYPQTIGATGASDGFPCTAP